MHTGPSRPNHTPTASGQEQSTSPRPSLPRRAPQTGAVNDDLGDVGAEVVSETPCRNDSRNDRLSSRPREDEPITIPLPSPALADGEQKRAVSARPRGSDATGRSVGTRTEHASSAEKAGQAATLPCGCELAPLTRGIPRELAEILRYMGVLPR
jgi:hypothetical protein